MNLKKTIEISVMVGAALLEVGGDALIRKGWRGGGLSAVVLGFAVLGSYGVLLTMLEVDFSRLLGAYVALFALASVLFGWLVFGERIGPQMWIGLGVLLIGSVIMQLAPESPTEP